MTDVGPTRVTAQLVDKLQELGLSEIANRMQDLIARAGAERWTAGEFLEYIADLELARRRSVEQEARLQKAAFPGEKKLEDFDVAQSAVSQDRFDYLASLAWIEEHENILLVGPPGTGKTHLLIGIGRLAIERGFTVRFFSAIELIELLYKALGDNSVSRVIEEILTADLVILDEMGFYPLDDIGTQLLFRFVSASYEQKSLAVASHWPFESWGRFLPERSTAVSILDRLLHHSLVIITSGESFRLRQAKSRERPWRRASQAPYGSTEP